MKRLHGAFLLLASLLIFWLILNGTLTRGIALAMAGFVAATVMALAVTGGLCFLTQCAIAPALLRILPRTRAKAISTATSGGGLEGQVQFHRTQGRKLRRDIK
jgi:hypothetical protein